MKKILLMLIIIFHFSLYGESTTYDRPNILFILADDLGWADVGFHDSRILTPNLDKLAEQSTELTTFYVQPVCTQTRAAFLTGRYPFRYGLGYKVIKPNVKHGLPKEEITIAKVLKQNGYSTAIFGKWHLGDYQGKFLPSVHGFDVHIGNYCGWVDYDNRARPNYQNADNTNIDWHNNSKIHKVSGYTTDLITEDAINWIKEKKKEKSSFFSYLAYTAPHGPLKAPKEFIEMYSNIKNSQERKYAAVVTALDSAIGKLLKTIKDEGLERKTLIFFTSDNGGKVNGGGFNHPLRGGKKDLYEGAFKVPTLIKWPGVIKAGEKIDIPMHVVDLFPTILSATKVSNNIGLAIDGIDLLPILLEGKNTRKELFYGQNHRGAAIRVGKYKLISYTKIGKNELYDLEKDPSENIDLSKDKPEIVKNLLKQIEHHISK